MINFNIIGSKKNHSTHKKWLYPSLLLCAAALTGCGGGGSSTTTTNTTTTLTPPTTTSAPPTACSLTAQTGGIASGALAQINNYRSAAFLGAALSPALLFNSDSNLVASAGNHSNYLSLLTQTSPSIDPRTHDEVATNPCFTGTTVNARIAFTGDTDTVVGEDFSETSFAAPIANASPALAAQTGASIVDGLFDAVYHRMSLLSNFTNVGVAWQTSTTPNLPPTILTIDLAQHQVNTYNNLITYPSSGQTNVLLDWLVDESPCPLGCNNTGALAGFPITIQTDGRALVISSFTVTGSSGNISGAVLTATAGTYAADANLVAENAFDRAAFVPLSPLSPNTTYTVTVVGTTGGVGFTKTWTFTTLAVTTLQLTSSATTVSTGGTFDLTFSGGSQNYNVSSGAPLSWVSVNGPSAPSAVSLSYVQLATNNYQFTYNGQCTITAGCPVTFTATDSHGDTATTQVTVMP